MRRRDEVFRRPGRTFKEERQQSKGPVAASDTFGLIAGRLVRARRQARGRAEFRQHRGRDLLRGHAIGPRANLSTQPVDASAANGLERPGPGLEAGAQGKICLISLHDSTNAARATLTRRNRLGLEFVSSTE